MFGQKSKANNEGLDDAIASVLSDLDGFTSETEEYAASVDRLVKLYAIREANQPKKISPDTLVIVAANLLGIMIIVNHERMNVITSKALAFLPKLR